MMSHSTALPTTRPISTPAPVPLRELLPWAIFGLLIAIIAVYFIGAEQGAISIFGGQYVHELMHDGRHLLGFPCH
jgi:Probable cobalt transporter subunit (CbtB)